jgi:hypothetical protein
MEPAENIYYAIPRIPKAKAQQLVEDHGSTATDWRQLEMGYRK